MAVLTLLPSSHIQSMPDISLFSRCHLMGGVRKKEGRNYLSHQRIHMCFVGGQSLPSELAHSQSYN